MFLDEVLALKDRYLTRFSVAFVMSREPQDVEWFNGRIDAAKLREFARHDLRVAEVDEFFVCGPGTMGEDIPRALARARREGPDARRAFRAAVAAGERRRPPAAAARPAPVAAAGERRDHGRDGRPAPPLQHAARAAR